MIASVLVLGLAFHTEPGYRSIIPGVAAKLAHERAFIAGGIYRNSIAKPSRFVMVGIDTGTWNGFGATASAGYIDGYEQQFPIGGMAGVYYERGRYKTHALYIGNGAALMLEIRL